MDLIVKGQRFNNLNNQILSRSSSFFKNGLVSVPANMSLIMSSRINVIICCPDMWVVLGGTSWRVQMQKPLSAIWNFLLYLVFFSGSYVYVQLFHFNSNENNIFIAIKMKLLNLHILIKMLILEETFKQEAFAS